MNTNACLLALEKALQLEIDGMGFYRKAAAESKNQLAKEMFAYLADAEVTHMDRIKQISESLKTTGNWCKTGDDKGHADIKDIFKRLAKENKDKLESEATDVKAIETGLELEVKSIDFYTGQYAGSNDASEKAFYLSLVDEENSHYRTLQDVKFYLEDPEAWFAEHEKHGFDGA